MVQVTTGRPSPVRASSLSAALRSSQSSPRSLAVRTDVRISGASFGWSEERDPPLGDATEVQQLAGALTALLWLTCSLLYLTPNCDMNLIFEASVSVNAHVSQAALFLEWSSSGVPLSTSVCSCRRGSFRAGRFGGASWVSSRRERRGGQRQEHPAAWHPGRSPAAGRQGGCA